MPGFNDRPPIEQLAIKQALFKKLADDVDTKNPDSLRAQLDESVVNNYKSTGYKTMDVFVEGEKVGTYTARTSKGKPEEVRRSLVVIDGAKLEQYINSDECTEEVIQYAQLMADNFADFMLNTYGIVCDGCEVMDEVIPAQPPRVTGTTFRIDPDKVADALGSALPTTLAGLLKGSDDGTV